MKTIAALIFIIFAALIVVIWSKQHQAYVAMPMVNAEAEVIPWQLNTQCTINSRNLPVRDPEEIV